MKPRLLVLTSTFPHSATDSATPPFVFHLCSRLASVFEVDVLAPHSPGSAEREHLGALNVVRYRYAPVRWETLNERGGMLSQLRGAPWRAALIPLMLIAQFFALWRQLRRQRYSAVHAHWMIPQGAIAALALALSKNPPPLIVTAHGADVFALKGIWAQRLRQWVIGRAAATAAVSEALRSCLERHGPQNKLHVLPMGVDLKTVFVPPQKDQLRKKGQILFAGRLVEKKGVPVLLEALAQVIKTHPQAQLLIVGSGALEDVLKQQATQLGITAHVRFHGNANQLQLAELYREAQVLAFPSVVAGDGDQEGLGLVPIEALGCECAVVASDLPALRGTILDEDTGLLAQSGSDVHLAAQLRRLLDDATLRERLGTRGRQHALQFDWVRTSSAYIDLLLSVIGTDAEISRRSRPPGTALSRSASPESRGEDA